LLGVEAAHLQGVVHRDLKPENILVNGADFVVVADFGIARFEEEDLYTAVETQDERLANFQYSAPEQRARGRAVNARADIYALALILNELFTGEVPSGTGYKTVRTVSPSHSWIDDVVEGMMRQSPDERPDSIAAVKSSMARFAEQFATRQRMDELKHAVVATDAITDPLALNPVTVTDAHWDEGVLIVTLSQPVNNKWINALRKIGSYTSAYNAGPDAFRFTGNVARAGIDGGQANDALNYFKDWLPRAHAVYADMLRREAREAEQVRQQQIQRERQALEERQRVNKGLNI
jgi:serine/threonine protein kinase